MTAAQLEPPFVERKTPAAVPAKILDPLASIATTVRLVNPVFDAAQFYPLSVETKTPPPSVLTYRVEPTFSKQYMLFTVIPVLLLTHCATDTCCIRSRVKKMPRALISVFIAFLVL